MRSAEGSWIIAANMRLYTGLEDEAPDPLIASAEGPDAAPAYRGMAYAVFEDLDLTEFANHIPSLSFEVAADEAQVSAAAIIADLGAITGLAPSRSTAEATPLRGFGLAMGRYFRSVLANNRES